jgi:hypothetical protein
LEAGSLVGKTQRAALPAFGKTMLAVALGRHAVEAGFRVYRSRIAAATT